MRPLRSYYEPVLDDLSESAGRLSSKSVLQKPAGVFTWTSLLSSHDLSHSATLDLRRQMAGKNAGDAAVLRSVDDLAETFAVADLILPGGYEKEQHVKRSTLPHGDLVTGSKQHTASNLINAVQELSN
jgi:hypothetical protein